MSLKNGTEILHSGRFPDLAGNNSSWWGDSQVENTSDGGCGRSVGDAIYDRWQIVLSLTCGAHIGKEVILNFVSSLDSSPVRAS